MTIRVGYSVTAASRARRRHLRKIGRAILAHLVLLTGAIIFVIPFLWMVSTSLKLEMEVLRQPPKWIPYPPHFENYRNAWTLLPFDRFLLNTLTITSLGTMGQLITCTLVAFGFARLSFPGRNALFVVLLATMMLPGQVTMIPQFVLFRMLGWLDTIKPLVVPAWIGGSPFYIFMLRQFFMGLPWDLDDAARMDGCSSLRIYWNIVLPLSGPAIAAVAVFSFINYWNDFMGPLIYLSSPNKMTIAVGLQLFRGRYTTQLNQLMAGSTAAVIPILVVFFLAQKYFIQGIALTGLKG